jgi:C-terminal processing protease CtpA/Prc
MTKYILASLFIIICHFTFSQSLTEQQKDTLIERIKTSLIENYVVEEHITTLVDSLRADNYYDIASIDSLIKKMNQDFYRLSHDKHLSIEFRPTIAKDLLNDKDIHTDQNKREKKDHYGFEKPKILSNNIGYLKLNYFANAKNAKKNVLKNIRHFKKTEALIIDLRENLGGNVSMLQLLLGVFLPIDKMEILKINYKSGKISTIEATKIKPNKQYLKQPIYILCDSQTFSAGEAFAFVMKNRNRALIIGETTAGAGHVAGPYAINEQFVLTVPVGIIVDPLTNTGWEQTGVTPDIMSSSNKALEKVFELIRSSK